MPIYTIFSLFLSVQIMASPLKLRPYKFHSSTVRGEDRGKHGPVLDATYLYQINLKEKEKYGLATSFIFQGFLRKCTFRGKEGLLRHIPVGALSSMSSSEDSGESFYQDETSFPMDLTSEMERDRVNCLLLLLHESARSFSSDVQALVFVKRGPELTMAWAGVDVHAWHTRIAHQVAVYAMLNAAVQVEMFLSQNRCNNPSPVHDILSERMNFLAECIESQLSSKNPKLVEWYKSVELPPIAGLFVSLFKKWSFDYAGSGVAGFILAISCCSAIRKLGPGKISPSISVSVEHAVNELMTAADGFISICKYYKLATKAGFEEEFLWHFGRKILPNENIENLECWVELIEKKLSIAFDRECIFTNKHTVYDKDALAIVGLFAYLGRETRLFLSRMNIKDLDEQTKDFLGHLECGGLLIYPEYSTLSEYQLFMEVVTDEIEWIDFFAAFDCETGPAIKRPKQYATQAEKDMILVTAYTVCYDVISAFAHYTNSKQQPLSALLLEFLLQSQNLLSACLEDFWAAYGGTGEWWKTAERGATSLLINGTTHSSVLPEQQQKPIDLITGGKTRWEPKLHQAAILVERYVNPAELSDTSVSKPFHEDLIKKSTGRLISASHALWMGSQLLLIDILESLQILIKQMRGEIITRRERKKLDATMVDMATLVPITILMLLPVSAVGHAAMLAAIKKYMPYLIPSPFSSERRGYVKQVNRMKKLEVEKQTSVENLSTRIAQK